MSKIRVAYVVFGVCVAASAAAQVPTIIKEIDQLESQRDPKCYATANRLEDFIYGTSLDFDARAEKIALQKRLIRDVWVKATAAAKGKAQIGVDALRPILQTAVPYVATPGGDWIVFPDDPRRTDITARDKRQYGAVAYALRAILSVQQDAFVDGTNLLPLDEPAVELFKESVDLITLAALQRADKATRTKNEHQINGAEMKAAWAGIVGSSKPAVEPHTAAVKSGEKFATIKAIVAEKLAAFEKYNDLSNAVFSRNVQVYMARHMWPTDAEDGTAFKKQFTETMVAWTGDVMLEAEKRAKKRGHPLIRIDDVHDAVQMYEPHVLNEYEDCIYFPRLPKSDQIVIEAYDLDAFRDPGLHWMYLNEVLNDPKYKGTIEPDPFAAELLTEGGAQMGTLILRVAGKSATAANRDRLDRSDLSQSLKTIQTLLDKNAALPPVKKVASTIASAPSKPSTKGKFFTDVTANSGIKFEHRMSDWLARLIRSYSIKETETVLAVPPAFGGSGIAAEDVNGDGFIDVLVLSGSGNALYLGDGKGHFNDVTESAGLNWKRTDGRPGEPRQPIIADFDNDGLPDILITYADDDHRLYRNLGNAKFEDITARTNLGGKGLVGGPATALDFDKDGLLDLYIGYFGDYVHGVLPTFARRNINGLPNKLFRNKGNFVFEDVTAGSGVDNTGWAQAINHVDFDGDGWEDLICGNDFGANSWYRNLGRPAGSQEPIKFEEVSSKLGTDKPSYTMNIGITDLNRDGFPDVYISNIVTMNKDEKYVLPDAKTRLKFNPQKMANMRVVEANDLWTSNAKDGKLISYAQSDTVGRGYRSTGWSWGANFFDFDNDGDDDLYLVNGMNEYAVYSSVNPYFTNSSGQQQQTIVPVAEKEAPVFFVNRNGMLEEQSTQSGADPAGNARAVVQFDMDNDGALDMMVNNFNAPAMLYRNHGATGNHWIKIHLTGDPSKGVTRDAIGAKILVDTAHQKNLWREVFSTLGYLTSPPKEQHLGLGTDTRADVTVIWPNGDRQTLKNLAADHTYQITQK